MKRRFLTSLFAVCVVLCAVVPVAAELRPRYVVLDTLPEIARFTDFTFGRVWEVTAGPRVSIAASYTSTSDVAIEAIRFGIVMLDYFNEIVADYKVSVLGQIEPGVTDSLRQDVPLLARRTPLTGFIWVDAARLSDGRLIRVPREDVERMMDEHLRAAR